MLPRVKLSPQPSNDDDGGKPATINIDVSPNNAVVRHQYKISMVNSGAPATINRRSIAEIVETSRRAFEMKRKTIPVKYRKSQLKGLLKLLVDNETVLSEAVDNDLRKHRHETILFETELIANDIRHLLINLDKYVKRETPEDKPLVNFFDGVYVHYEPYGVVLIIGAWNNPLKGSLGPLAGAIAAGNCAIINPCELCPATSQLLADLLPNYLDSECYHVVRGHIENNNLLNERFDYIFYTGSPTIGRLVHKAANTHLTPMTLVVPGKNPAYIDHTADIEKTARRIIWGKCVNAGRTCIAPDYILCTKQVQAKFVGCASKILREFYGDEPKLSADYGRVMNDQHYARLLTLLKGLNIVVGGQIDASQRYIAPTIACDVSPTHAIMADEEIFGPILPIVVINDLNEAITFINERTKPMALYVFTGNKKSRDQMLARTSSGGVVVNDCLLQASVECLPFGSVGGMGAYHGRKSFEVFSHQKSVLVKDFNPMFEKAYSSRYPPYTDFKLKFAKEAMKRRRQVPFNYVTHLFVFLLGIGLVIAIYFINKAVNG